MRHIDDGVLRRLVDEPLLLSDRDRSHLTGCDRCRERREEIAANAERTAALFSGAPPVTSPERALARFGNRVAADGGRARPAPWARWSSAIEARRRGLTAPLGGIAAAMALLGALTLTPAGSWAQSFVTIFQPKQFQVVPVTTDELASLPQLDKFGTMRLVQHGKPHRYGSVAAAATAAGSRILTPSSVPSSVPKTVTIRLIPSITSTFTFSAAKAQQEAQVEGKTLPAMPAKINGSTLQLSTGTGVLQMYGNAKGIPALIVGQTAAPTVSSTGVSVREMEDYVLSLPGVSPQLAAQIRAIGDPTSTLPIPIPVDQANAKQVQVQGVNGLAIGDSTGIGSGVVWQKDGEVYGVAGPLPLDQVVAIANGLR